MEIEASKEGKHILAHAKAEGIQLGRILANKAFGTVTATIDAHGTLDDLSAKCEASRFDFNDYPFKDIKLDGRWNHGTAEGTASINDPNVALSASEASLPPPGNTPSTPPSLTCAPTSSA